MTNRRFKPGDDPVLAMCALWQANCVRLEEACTVASRREQALFDATDADRPEAERQHLEAARVRDRMSDELYAQAESIFKVGAQTFEGVAAKLAVVVQLEAPSPTDPLPPWPYFRSVQDDLARLIAAARPA
jgi:hypothetical protein